jgi:SAM-dependent methyltransferase
MNVYEADAGMSSWRQCMMAMKESAGTANDRLRGARARRWAEIQEGQFRLVYEAVLQKAEVSSATSYLDVGCGSGVAVQMAAARGAHVTGIDTVEELVNIARAHVPTGRFYLGDLEQLPFESGTFDVVSGFNSFQYAANPTVALTEARRVTRRGGTVMLMNWGRPDGMEATAMIGALCRLLPPPPPGVPAPFVLSNEASLRAFAAGAGLTPAAVFDINCQFRYHDEATALRGFNSTPGAIRAIEYSGEQAVTQAHAKALSAFRRPDGSYKMSASFRYLLAFA